MEVSNNHGGYTFPHPSRMCFNPRRVDLSVRTVDDDDRFGIKEVKGRGCRQDESELMILGMKSPGSMGWGSVILEGGRRRMNEQEKSPTTQTTSFITDPTLYNNNSQQNRDGFCSFRHYDGAIN
jgi:hypothetical protein